MFIQLLLGFHALLIGPGISSPRSFFYGYYAGMSFHFLQEPWFWVIFTAASELIGMSKLRENSVLQLLIHGIEQLKPPKSDV